MGSGTNLCAWRLIDIPARIGKRGVNDALVCLFFRRSFLPDAASHDTAQDLALPVDERAFRSLMGQFATGVCVVATERAGSGPVGITVNSFVSVSLEPMLVGWSLHNSATQFDVWSKADAFSISILADNQQALARTYASHEVLGDPLKDFAHGQSGMPHIVGALGYLECRPWKLVPAGDHTMILGEVTGLYRAEALDGAAPQPLLFFGSAFRKIAEK